MIEEYHFDDGIIALDIDAPTRYFWDGNPGREKMVQGVEELCQALSRKYDLGRFWIYHTLSGVHVIFERRTDISAVLEDATFRSGWHECGGHYDHCIPQGHCSLRVSRKQGRGWDIYPVEGYDVDTNVPLHVRGHRDALLSNLRPW